MSAFTFDEVHLKAIAAQPHLLGHMVGKDLLGPLHSKWMLDAWTSTDHYALQAHRGSYKTTALTELGVIWWLLFHPGDRVAVVRKTVTEAAKTIRVSKRHFMRDEVKALFEFAHGMPPAFTINQDTTCTLNFKTSTTKEGSIDAFGVDSAMTGSHYDVIICDDIISRHDRLFRAERERTKDFLYELQTNIIDPGKHIIHVGTPWHRDDAWQVTPPDATYDVYQTGLLTPEQIAGKRRTTTPDLFAANYELKHISPSDGLFADRFATGLWDPGATRPVAHLDAKFDGDHTAALTIMATLPGNKIQWTGWVFPEHVKERVPWIVAQLKRYRVQELHIETNPDKGYTADLIRKAAVSSGYLTLHVATYAESTNKHVKITSYLLEYADRLVLDQAADPDYIEQVINYREGQEPDDAPDSAASLLRQVYHKNAGTDALWRW